MKETIRERYLALDSVLWQSSFRHCLSFAIANAVHAMGYKSKAMKFLRSGACSVRKLSHEIRWIEKVLRTVGMRRVEFPDGTDIWRWLRDQTEKVYLVQLNG